MEKGIRAGNKFYENGELERILANDHLSFHLDARRPVWHDFLSLEQRDAFHSLIVALRNNKTIERVALDCTFNPLWFKHSELQSFFQTIGNLHSLLKLHIVGGWNFKLEGSLYTFSDQMTDLLPVHSQVEELMFERMTSLADLQPLCLLLPRLTTLRTLHVKGGCGYFEISDFLRGNDTLEELVLDHIVCDRDQIAETLRVNSSLKTLELKGISLYPSPIRQSNFYQTLSEALMVNSTLEVLMLGGSEPDPYVGVHFSRVLSRNTTLRCLELPSDGSNYADTMYREVVLISHQKLASAMKKNYAMKRLILPVVRPVKNDDEIDTVKFYQQMDGILKLLNIYTTLNRAGRGDLKFSKNRTHGDWIEALCVVQTSKYSVECAYELLCMQPGIVFSKRHV